MIKVILKNGNILTFAGHCTCCEHIDGDIDKDRTQYAEIMIDDSYANILIEMMGYKEEDVVSISRI